MHKYLSENAPLKIFSLFKDDQVNTKYVNRATRSHVLVMLCIPVDWTKIAYINKV